MNFCQRVREKKKFLLYLVLAGVVLALDQISKGAILGAIGETTQGAGGMEDGIYLTKFLSLVLLWNRGGCFGLMNGLGPISGLLLTVAIAVAVSLLAVLWRRSDDPDALCFSLVLGGTLGNAVDRIFHGAVIDFIDFHISQHHWPSFNVADSAISLGIFLYLIHDLLGPGDRAREGGGSAS
ncbi:MAG: signal peptidase II [Rickettsiales bacterium]|jgi:signal peptidase II|nr:signal peptidase II [Rickettsiales bacterium]